MVKTIIRIVAASKMPERAYHFRKQATAQFDDAVKTALKLPKNKDVEIIFRGATDKLVAMKAAALRQLLKFRHLENKLHIHKRDNTVWLGRA